MSLYSQMQGIPGPSSHADEPVQRKLERLLRQLSWSYVALWSFDHQTRSLGWRGGHFRVNSTTVTLGDDTEVWNQHFFNSTYKSCIFASGQGCVGTAHAETRNIWMNGPSVHHSAGSKEQAQFFMNAGIKTAVCIPWANEVLELGTRETVAEDLYLTAYMCIVLSEHILPALTEAPTNCSQTSLGVRRALMQSDPLQSLNPTRHLLDKSLAQDFELNSFTEQIRRSSSMSSLNTDMFLQQAEVREAGKELSIEEKIGVALTTSRVADIQLQTQNPPLPAPNQALMSSRVHYRSQSGTTSSSLSISEDGSIWLSVDSPEHTKMSLVASSQRHNSPRRGTPSLKPEVQIGEKSTPTGIIESTQNLHLEDEIIHMLEEGAAGVDTQKQWRNMYFNPSLEPGNVVSEKNMLDLSTLPSMSAFHTQDEFSRLAFKSWRHTGVQAAVIRRNDGTNQALLRRCIEMMKRIPILQSDNSLQGLPLLASISTSPEIDSPDIRVDDTFEQNAPLRRQRRPRGSKPTIARSGHVGHNDAATNHMLAERNRRIKQKENFTSLRKVVPIISKADKASILGDAVLYIKNLEEEVRELESSRAETESRYKNLEKAHQELQQRNKELEAMAAGHGEETHPPTCSRAPQASTLRGNPSNIIISLVQRSQFVSGSFME